MFAVNWKEDSNCEVLARVVARNGSGDEITNEGKWVQQADVTSITATVYDLTSDPTTIDTDLGSLTISSVILDTPSTVGWSLDTLGYNFVHNIASTVFTTGGNIYRVEYKFTLTGGYVFFEYLEGPCNKIIQS